ncbi:MAG: peptide chain release factor 1 [Ilumatobacteraceae bacterium]
MIDRLAGIEDEYALIEASLGDPELLADPARLREATRRYKELGPLVEALRDHRARLVDLEATRELAGAATGSERDEWRAELSALDAQVTELEERIRTLMLPRDPNDGRAVIMEIRGAEGGEEANLFARDLFEMYRAFAARRGWKFEVLSTVPSELGGLNQATIVVRGDAAWSHLKFEGGPHRVQRVPVTESQGRVHTSSATVLVLPEADEVDVDIDERDIEVDVYRSSGAGGQSVNTTDSAVRVTHKPTGVVVTMQDERSQLQNKARALLVLRARLLKLAQDQHDAAMSVERRAQVGGGGRGEKIRTYNFKENRVTDHRIGFTTYRLADVLAGDLDDVVDALIADERARQLATGA